VQVKISHSIKIPQYRVKAIEKPTLHEIKVEMLDKYIEYLGLQDDFNLWLEKNKDVYQGLGMKSG